MRPFLLGVTVLIRTDLLRLPRLLARCYLARDSRPKRQDKGIQEERCLTLHVWSSTHPIHRNLGSACVGRYGRSTFGLQHE